MIKHDARNRISYRHPAKIVHSLVLVCFGTNVALAPIVAMADVPYTPPPMATHYSGFPSEQALRNQGYNPQTGTLRVNTTPNGRPVVTSNGTTVTGTQNVRTTATGNYGEKAVINSSVTQSVSGSTLNRLIGIAWVASGVSNGITHNSGRTAAAIASGNYGNAALEASKSMGYGVDSMFGGFLNMGANAISNGKATSAAATAQQVWDSVLGGGGGSATGGGISANAPHQGSAHGGSQGGQMTADSLRNVANAAQNAQTDAIKRGDVGGAIAAASVAKAANTAATATEASGKFDRDSSNPERDAQGRPIYPVTVTFIEYGKDSTGTDNGHKIISQTVVYSYLKNHEGSNNGKRDRLSIPSIKIWGGQNIVGGYIPYTFQGKYNFSVTARWEGMRPEPPPKEDFSLNESEIAGLLRQMLANQQTNHAEMMRVLSSVPVPGSENLSSLPSIPSGQQGGGTTRDTSVNGSAAPSIVDGATESVSNTGGQAVSDPYTPAGSTMPQQTVFTLNADGSVTQSVVKRPDLVPHSAQAPTRYPVTPGQTATSPAPEHNIPAQPGTTAPAPTTPGTTTPAPTQPGQPTTPGTSQPGDTQTNDDTRNDFCKANPTAPQCTGEDDYSYEDLLIPETQIDLQFKPLDIFSTNGTCPQSKSFDMGILGSLEMSYEVACDVASKMRPILVLITMIACMSFAYSAAREV